MNIVVVTAKGGNLSIPNKNLIKIKGRSLLSYVIESAQESEFTNKVYVSTEDDLIMAEAKRYGASVIKRPKELALPDSNHGDTILHAFRIVEQQHEKISSLTILLGNSILIRPDDIDAAISKLHEIPDSTSCMTVWEAQDDHPYRAMVINEYGFLSSFENYGISNTNRQSYPKVVFYDQGPWVIKPSTLRAAHKKCGPACWWWMGDKCVPIIRPWVTGKDVHTYFDVAIQEAWFEKQMWKIM